MNETVSAVSATGAAALFALGTAVQSRALHHLDERVSSSSGPQRHEDDITKGLRVVTKAVAYPGWLGGSAIAVAAFGLHAVALHEGTLTLVQPLLVSSVLFALPAARFVSGVSVTPRELAWAAALVLALGTFFAAANPSASAGRGADLWPAVGASFTALAAITLCIHLARGRAGSSSAALLGAGTGIAFAGVAALTKSATDSINRGLGGVFTGWQVYGLLMVGAVGIVLSQLAYRAGPLSASLPAINSVNPLASVLIGVSVSDEHFRTGLVASTVEGISLSTLTLATVMLSRVPKVHGGRQPDISPEPTV